MSMMVSFVLSFFPRDVLDEILNLVESVSEDFPSYSCTSATLTLQNTSPKDLHCGWTSVPRMTTPCMAAAEGLKMPVRGSQYKLRKNKARMKI